MGFTDSLKKVIGIEEVDDDEIVTEEEIAEAKRKIARDSERKTKVMPSVSSYSDDRDHFRPEKKQVSYSRPTSSEKRFSVINTNSLKLILIEPKGLDECPKLVDSLKARKPVIINLEKLETETARKIFDFLSGATYALSGNVQKIANNIFIFTPENVAVSAQQSTQTSQQSPEEKSPWR